MSGSRIFRSVTVTVLILILLALVMGAAVYCCNDSIRAQAAAVLTEPSFGMRVACLCVSVLILILALLALICPLFQKKHGADLMLSHDKTGTVSIRTEALEKMAEIAVRGVSGITVLSTDVTMEEDVLVYTMRVRATQSVLIPPTVLKIQEKVAQFVVERVGVRVSRVDVSIASYQPEESGIAAVTPRVR